MKRHVQVYILLERVGGDSKYKGVYSNLTELFSSVSKSRILTWIDHSNARRSLDSYSSFYKQFSKQKYIRFQSHNGREEKIMEVVPDWLNGNSPW